MSKIPPKNGDEQDCFYARKFYNWRAGEAKKIKTIANRRDRRTTRAAIREGREV
jgi:hypothetical protein